MPGAADRHARVNEELTRITLRPIANPLALGFLGLGGATVTLAGAQLGWYGPHQGTAVALVAVLFGFTLQFVASLFGFLSRDVVAASGMGILAANWLTIGVVKLLYPPGATGGALGVLLIFVGVALLVPALASAVAKLVPALVLATASARFIVTGLYEITSNPQLQTAAGILGLVLLAAAIYAALALELEDAQRRTVLPVLRWGGGATAMRGSTADQVAGQQHEAGVREQL